MRAHQFKLADEKWAAERQFRRRRLAVATATWVVSRIAARQRGKIDLTAQLSRRESRSLQPHLQDATAWPTEWLVLQRGEASRRLPDKQDTIADAATESCHGIRLLEVARYLASPACRQLLVQRGELTRPLFRALM